MKSVLIMAMSVFMLTGCGSTAESNQGSAAAKTTNKKSCVEVKTTGSRLAKKRCKSVG